MILTFLLQFSAQCALKGFPACCMKSDDFWVHQRLESHTDTQLARCLTCSPSATQEIHPANPRVCVCACVRACVWRGGYTLRQTGEILPVLPCQSQAISVSPVHMQAMRRNTHTHTHGLSGPLPAWLQPGSPWRRQKRRQEVFGELCVSLLLWQHFSADLFSAGPLPPLAPRSPLCAVSP